MLQYCTPFFACLEGPDSWLLKNFLCFFFQDMGYPPFGYYQPPPPPLHPNMAAVDPNISYRGLNVTDPRFAAKYGNPYLRSAAGGLPEVPQVPLGSPQMPQRGYPYATLNNRAYSPNLGQQGQQASAVVATAKANVNYTGTMVGNGKSSNNTPPAKSSQYILSPEADVEADAMATHV